MSSNDTPTAPERRPGRSRARAGRTIWVLATIAVAIIVSVGGYATYAYLRANSGAGGTTRLVVYTYDSLFGGNCGSPALSDVLAPFEAAHHVTIDLECPQGTLVATLLAEKSAPRADVVIGLDEITTAQAEANQLLAPYDSPDLAHVPATVVGELSPDHGATPYEWGYLGIDYNRSFDAGTGGAVARSAFPAFSANLSWAKQLVVENPTTDITGEEFLLWEIEFYESVLHQDWTSWWSSVGPSLQFAPDWGTAFSEFDDGPGSPSMAVSYTTDSSYAAANRQAGQFNSTVSTWNGTEYGWRTVYGIAAVAGSPHRTLDDELIDWFLGGSVQSAIPTNEWEYPANDTVAVPPEFAASIDPAGIVPLDDATTPSALATALPGYLDQWQQLANSWS